MTRPLKLSHRSLAMAVEPIDGARQIRVVCSSEAVDRMGDVIVQSGIDVSAFRVLKSVLWNHDQDRPIAKAIAVEVVGDHLEAVVEFPPEGVSSFADEKYGLIRFGAINAVSIGFGVKSAKPIDKARPKAGVVVETSELFELSFVSVPANPDAVIVERALTEAKVMKLQAKGLWQVAELAQALGGLGWLEDSVKWEAECEGDGSAVPAKLQAAMAALGQVLIEMTVEEVSEMIREETGEAGTKHAAVLFTKRMAARVRAGRTMSTANGDALRGACKAIADSHDAIKALVEALDAPEARDDDTIKPNTETELAPETKALVDRTIAIDRRRREADVELASL